MASPIKQLSMSGVGFISDCVQVNFKGLLRGKGHSEPPLLRRTPLTGEKDQGDRTFSKALMKGSRDAPRRGA
jgi:hypothetical protein